MNSATQTRPPEEQNLQITTPKVDMKEWLNECNGKRRTRLFRAQDYHRWLDALEEAKLAAASNGEYWVSDDSGTVAKAYRYPAHTAYWVVFALHGEVRTEYGTRRCNANEVWGLKGAEHSYKKQYRTTGGRCRRYDLAGGQLCIRIHWSIDRDRRGRGDAEITIPRNDDGIEAFNQFTKPYSVKGLSEEECIRLALDRLSEIEDIIPAMAVMAVVR